MLDNPKTDPKQPKQAKREPTPKATKVATLNTTQSAPEAPQIAPASPEPGEIRLKEEFDAVALWMALPRKERNPATQLELAAELGISDNSITDWRKRDDFWELVDSHRQRWIKDDISDVVSGLIKKAKYGSAAEVKLFLQFAGIFTETSKVEHSGQTAVSITYEYPDAQPAPDPNQTDR